MLKGIKVLGTGGVTHPEQYQNKQLFFNTITDN